MANNNNNNNNNVVPSSEVVTPSSSSSSSAGAATAAAATTTTAPVVTPPPTARQLTMHALRSAVPMIGFGFMDNTIMIHAGHYVDCTVGVAFGLSTLAAAGIGQIFSGIGGVFFGDALDAAFRGMIGGRRTNNNMTSAQKLRRASRSAGLLGGVLGVTLGCTLGLVNLLFVDEHRASLLKLRALEGGQEFEFEVEVDNEVHPGYTTVTVHGPDVDGVLASITASIASVGCSVVELHASPRRRGDAGTVVASVAAGEEDPSPSSDDDAQRAGVEDSNGAIYSILDQLVQSSSSETRMEDVFLIRDRSTHQAIDNDDLDDLARTVLAAAKDPLNSHSLKAQVDELRMENVALADRVEVLEGMLEDRQIKVRKSSADGEKESA